MVLTNGVLTFLIILIVGVVGLAIILVAWYLIRPSSKRPSAHTNVKTQPIVQRFVSRDLKKRAFVVHLNTGGYKVIYQHYSDEIINPLRGDVVGWQSLPEKPVADSLARAVEVAQSWAHSED